jgi:hypothetical protein
MEELTDLLERQVQGELADFGNHLAGILAGQLQLVVNSQAHECSFCE